MIAVEQGHEEVVRVILQQSKSDVHQAANDGVTTVFSLAKKNKDDKVLKLLHQVNWRPRPTLAHRPPPTPHRPPPATLQHDVCHNHRRCGHRRSARSDGAAAGGGEASRGGLTPTLAGTADPG